MGYVGGQARGGGGGGGGRGGAAGGGGARGGGPAPLLARLRRPVRCGSGRWPCRSAVAVAAEAAHVQGLPLIKPPYDQITAYDMNKGEIVWQKTHSSTPDDIKNNPALKGLTLPRLGQPGRTFIGVLTTKNLVIAGEGGVHTNAAGRRVALLRAYDKLHRRRRRRGGDAGKADRIADELSDRRQAVHRARRERERRRRAAGLRASLMTPWWGG